MLEALVIVIIDKEQNSKPRTTNIKTAYTKNIFFNELSEFCE
jgi:hypothetical protein